MQKLLQPAQFLARRSGSAAKTALQVSVHNAIEGSNMASLDAFQMSLTDYIIHRAFSPRFKGSLTLFR
jgi:hypothetical protein